MEHYQELTFYVPSTKGIRNTDTYVFLPTKYALPKTAAADRATAALEEFTDAIKKPATKTIPLQQSSINNAINALTGLLSPNETATTTQENAVPPRVETRQTQAPPRVQTTTSAPPRVNNNNNDRVLRPRHEEIPQNIYPRYNCVQTIQKEEL